MSWQATAWAARQTAGGQGPKCLLLMVANHAGPSGVCFPGRNLLAAECECSSKTVSAGLARLEEAGLIARLQRRRADGSRATDWVVLGPGYADRGEMVDADPEEVPGAVVEAIRGSDTDYSGEESLGEDNGGGQGKISGGPLTVREQAKGRSARERALSNGQPLGLRYRGRAVPEPITRVAVEALTHYAAASGQAVQRWTPGGEPTEDLRRALGACVNHPEVDAGRWREVVDGVLAAPWWEGEPSVGVVFGPRVVDQNLRSPGRGNGAGPRRETASARQAREKDERVAARLRRVA